MEIKEDNIEWSESIVKKAEIISKELPYDNNCYFVKNIKGEVIYAGIGRYSYLLAMLGERMEYKMLTVCGVVKGRDGYALTIQDHKKKKVIDPGKIDVSIGGAVEKGESIREALLKELKEELGIKREDINKIKEIGAVENTSSVSIAHLIEVNISFEDIMERWKNAKDAWEIRELVKIKKLKDLRKEEVSNILRELIEKGDWDED